MSAPPSSIWSTDDGSHLAELHAPPLQEAHDLAVHGHFLLMGALLERGEVGELDALLVRQGQLIDQYAAGRFVAAMTELGVPLTGSA